MAKFKHIKYTKLSPILLETIPPQWSRHSVARRKTLARRPRPGDGGFFSLVLELILLGVAT